MGIPVKLPVFEGPLDLLLHLLEKNRVNIVDIPIVEITEQYMEYMKGMEAVDLDVMSEFLVMAAELLKIKSRMLLPKPASGEEPLEDPRQDLVRRLLEHKLYQYMAGELRTMEEDAARVVYRDRQLPDEVALYKEKADPKQLLSDLTLTKLRAVFRMVMQRREDRVDPVRSRFGRIVKEEISLSEKIMEIQQYGLIHRRFSFQKLLSEQADKTEVIAAFLGILELIRMGQLEIEQEELFGEIEISYVADDIKPVKEPVS